MMQMMNLSDTGENLPSETVSLDYEKIPSDIDVALLDDLFDSSKDLGPDVLKNPKYDSLINPFTLLWTFGYNVTVPVLNLKTKNRFEVFYACSNIGVVFDCEKNDKILLRGHRNKIFTATVDRSCRWLATADSDEDGTVLFWDTIFHKLVFTIFIKRPRKIRFISLSPSAKFLTIVLEGEEEEVIVELWEWTSGQEEPRASVTLGEEYTGATVKAIKYHPDKEEHSVLIFERFVVFMEQPALEPFIQTVKTSRLGRLTSGTYVKGCHECFVSTVTGNILVYGNTLYKRPFDEAPLDNKTKIFVNSIQIAHRPLVAMETVEENVILLDNANNISILSKTLKLIQWYPTVVPAASQPPLFMSLGQDPNSVILSMTDGSVFLVTLSPEKSKMSNILTSAGSPVAAIDVHDEYPYVLVAYENKRLILFNYETKEEVTSAVVPDVLEEPTKVATVKYSSEGLHLLCGKSNGELWILQPVVLLPMIEVPYQMTQSTIQKIVFAPDNRQMAYFDGDNTVCAFTYDAYTNHWVFKGKVRSHYKDITNIFFNVGAPSGLYTVARDRYLVRYEDILKSAETNELNIKTRIRVEQRDVPCYMIPYVKVGKSGYFLEADDKHKYKVLSARGCMCTSVALGPAYGCFEHDPVKKMEFLPKSSKYLVFMNSKHVGIQLVPVDGNPYKFVGCLAHPEELMDFAMSSDGKFLFTCGANDTTVLMWKVRLVSVETMNQLGGEELLPYYCLLEGGRNGLFFKEIEDIFFFMQIMHQGVDQEMPRVVKDTVDINELPELVRACGYYPSEYEIENMLTDIRYRNFDENSTLKVDISFVEFVRLFVNHKPAYGYPLEDLEEAFDVLTRYCEDWEPGSMSREDFVEALISSGEVLTSEQLLVRLTTLMHPQEEICVTDEEALFEFLPPRIDFDILVDDILGIDIEAVRERIERAENGAESCSSSSAESVKPTNE